MSRVHLILMAVKWQIESSSALWILGIVSYLLYSSMIKVMGDVLSMTLDDMDIYMLLSIPVTMDYPAMALHHVPFQ